MLTLLAYILPANTNKVLITVSHSVEKKSLHSDICVRVGEEKHNLLFHGSTAVKQC